MAHTTVDLMSPANLTCLVDSLPAEEVRQRLVSVAQGLAELPCECERCGEPPCIRCALLDDLQGPKS